MNAIWAVSVVACLAGLFVCGWLVGSGSHAKHLARLTIEKVRPPSDDEWLLPFHRRGIWGGGLSFVLLSSLVSVSYGFGVLGMGGSLILGLVGAIVTLGPGYWIGYQLSKPRGSIAPYLAEFGAQAAQRSAVLAAAGDSEGAAAAQGLADWTTKLALNAPHLTLANYERYYTPYLVGQLIEDRFVYGSDSDSFFGDLEHWLANTDELLYEDPEEARRVELLHEVRNTDEIVERLNEPYEPVVPERIRELIKRLKSESSPN